MRFYQEFDMPRRMSPLFGRRKSTSGQAAAARAVIGLATGNSTMGKIDDGA